MVFFKTDYSNFCLYRLNYMIIFIAMSLKNVSLIVTIIVHKMFEYIYL